MPASAAGQEAAARVERVEVRPARVEMVVGGTLDLSEVEVRALDGDGRVVEDVRALPLLRSRAATLEGGRVVTHRSGEAFLIYSVIRPAVDGRRQPPARGGLAIVVRPEPLERLVIDTPPVRPYAGTVLALSTRGVTASGTERVDFETTWTSRNEDVARVDRAGNLRAVAPGRTVITAFAEGVDESMELDVLENPVRTVALDPPEAEVRTGDVVRFRAATRDADGREVDDVAVTFSVTAERIDGAMGASVFPDGAFVAQEPGTYRVAALAGGYAADAVLTVAPRDVAMNVVGEGQGLVTDSPTSDLWVFEGLDGRDYAYTGTHSGGQKMFAWDVTDPAAPVLVDSVVVDARVVNDVKVNEARTLAVITREGASTRRNGMVVLDLADPAHPAVRSEYTETLTGGVHNVFWHGELVYAVHNGTGDIHVIDLSNPSAPAEVGRWGLEAPGKTLHDVWIVDDLAYASYWDDGVWVLDVGDGRWGGTPRAPVPVSFLSYADLPGEWGNTHVAFPYTNADGHPYLFVGDEVFGCDECVNGPRGYIHILDLADPENLRQVARYEVPEAGAHNIWVEDDRLYVAYYQGGLRVVDVSGELRGDLYRQGREVAWFSTGSPDAFRPNRPMAWGPQPYKDRVYVSDMSAGLWVVRLEPKIRPLVP